MTTLKVLTLEKISSTLPSDLIDDFIQHHINYLILPKVTNLHRLLCEIAPDTSISYAGADYFLGLLHDFSVNFPEAIEKIEDVQKYILGVVFDNEPSHWYESMGYNLELIQYQFYYEGRFQSSILIFKMNDNYYTVCHDKIRGYKRHNEIIKFFTSRNIKITEGYELIDIKDFDST